MNWIKYNEYTFNADDFSDFHIGEMDSGFALIGTHKVTGYTHRLVQFESEFLTEAKDWFDKFCRYILSAGYIIGGVEIVMPEGEQ